MDAFLAGDDSHKTAVCALVEAKHMDKQTAAQSLLRITSSEVSWTDVDSQRHTNLLTVLCTLLVSAESSTCMVEVALFLMSHIIEHVERCGSGILADATAIRVWNTVVVLYYVIDHQKFPIVYEQPNGLRNKLPIVEKSLLQTLQTYLFNPVIVFCFQLPIEVKTHIVDTFAKSRLRHDNNCRSDFDFLTFTLPGRFETKVDFIQKSDAVSLQAPWTPLVPLCFRLSTPLNAVEFGRILAHMCVFTGTHPQCIVPHSLAKTHAGDILKYVHKSAHNCPKGCPSARAFCADHDDASKAAEVARLDTVFTFMAAFITSLLFFTRSDRIALFNLPLVSALVAIFAATYVQPDCPCLRRCRQTDVLVMLHHIHLLPLAHANASFPPLAALEPLTRSMRRFGAEPDCIDAWPELPENGNINHDFIRRSLEGYFFEC